MKVEANKPCCVCNCLDSEELFAGQFENHKYPGTFYLRRCCECGLIFNSPRLPDNEFPELYQASYYFHKRDNIGEFKRIAEMYRRTVALVQHSIDEKDVLEIGSAKGYLLAVMRKFGWTVQGMDLSENAASFANSVLHVPTSVGTMEANVEKYTSENRKFSLVLAIDLIEHVLYPQQFVDCLGRIVKDEGILIIDTPNGSSANIDYHKLKWKGFNPFHIFLFSVNNLTVLLRKYGFEIEKVFSYDNHDDSLLQQSSCCHDNKKESEPPFKTKFKSLLKKVGVFNGAVYFQKKYKKWIDGILSIHIRHTCNCLADGRSYLDTNDSRDTLAKDMKGDNLVIIARKIS